jgi:hypothetical protein
MQAVSCLGYLALSGGEWFLQTLGNAGFCMSILTVTACGDFRFLCFEHSVAAALFEKY